MIWLVYTDDDYYQFAVRAKTKKEAIEICYDEQFASYKASEYHKKELNAICLDKELDKCEEKCLCL